MGCHALQCQHGSDPTTHTTHITTMKLPFERTACFALGVMLTVAATAPAKAAVLETKICTYNGQNPMAATLAWNAYGFSMRWVDGVGNRYTYGPGPAKVTDSLGGRWTYEGRERWILMRNEANGNTILCG